MRLGRTNHTGNYEVVQIGFPFWQYEAAGNRVVLAGIKVVVSNPTHIVRALGTYGKAVGGFRAQGMGTRVMLETRS